MGAILVTISLLVWLVFRRNDVVSMSDQELGAFVALGSVLMLPELLYQVRQFFTSGSRQDDD
jgi:hypothetical protein